MSLIQHNKRRRFLTVREITRFLQERHGETRREAKKFASIFIGRFFGPSSVYSGPWLVKYDEPLSPVQLPPSEGKVLTLRTRFSDAQV